MNKLVKLFITSISAITLALVSFTSSFAKVEGDYIVLGSAISLTGKYSSNGVHTQNGYNMVHVVTWSTMLYNMVIHVVHHRPPCYNMAPPMLYNMDPHVTTWTHVTTWSPMLYNMDPHVVQHGSPCYNMTHVITWIAMLHNVDPHVVQDGDANATNSLHNIDFSPTPT